ncbi:MAG TPA: hypothetical protein ENJ50_11475, partial [Planctomycetaceae bacterium]|nr:hypothetical protein [Planctomycetaceae bacterium]
MSEAISSGGGTEPDSGLRVVQSEPDRRGVPAVELARRGWSSPLAVFVCALLLVQSVTGLWIYF